VKLFLIVLLTLCILPSAPAADKKPRPGASPTATPDDRVAFHGVIVAFSKSAQTFTLRGKKGLLVYVITDATKIAKGTAEGSLEDLAPGVYVRGASRRTGDGAFIALTVKTEPK